MLNLKEIKEEISRNVEALNELFYEFIDSDTEFTEEEVAEFIAELIPLRNKRIELFNLRDSIEE